jgi:mevalonate kinase
MLQSKPSSMPDRLSHRANGKLLLTAEYLVLNGSTALAIPLKFGQSLDVIESPTGHISWESHDSGGKWFYCKLNPVSFEVLNTDSDLITEGLIHYLSSARKLNPDFLRTKGLMVTVKADYPLSWGLGSSSSLISLIAKWANVDSWTLYKMCCNGSGYDLACAEHDFPVFYRLEDDLPEINKAEPAEALQRFAYFAYLGTKQNSAIEVKSFLKDAKFTEQDIDKITALTYDICKAKDYSVLYNMVEEHEAILSRILQKPKLKSTRFANFPGTVKSLGAWGGDFAMFISDQDPSDVRDSLKNLGIADLMFTFNELIR